ncbi:MAG: glucose-6-phosphate isomerase [Rhodomicrobium sp.]|nr:glucose-6-phosphate isomerase [Rhodomicrobium sp.]
MTVTQRIDGCLETAIGERGLRGDEIARWSAKLGPRFERLKQEARDKSLPHIGILYETDDLAEARAAYDKLVDGAQTLIVFGTGGSSLGGQALAQVGGWFIPGDDRLGKSGRPRLRFYDNLDALSLVKGMEILDLERTRFAVISKSGGTAETLSQTLVALDTIRRKGLEAAIPRMFLGITEPEQPGAANGLRALLASLGAPTIAHRTDIGGRYSAFTNVGMIPAFARGLDFDAFRAGGRALIESIASAETPMQFAPAAGAVIAAAFAKEHGVKVSVLMPYADRLARFSHWYVQLWAESLGKNDSEGTTPVAALGPVDQHSQLQLYLGGAQQHLTTIIRMTGRPDADTNAMPADLAALADAPYLAGRTIGDLVMAQTQAIGDAFTAHKRPVRIIELSRLDEWSLGWLMMHFMVETILTADLLGVDPFDQPAVELGKRLTKDYLARMAVGDETNADTPASAASRQPDRGG